MSQAEKVLLRYQYVMDATKNAQGDFARTADSVANQLKLLKENGNQLLQQFGDKLEPTVKQLLSAANELVPVISQFIDAIGEITEASEPLAEFVTELVKSDLTTILQTISSILRVMAPIINVISEAVQPILELVNGLLMLPVELIGNLFGSISKLEQNSKDIQFNVSSIAQHYQKIDTSTAIALQNIENQAKASARLKTILSGFDELNILNRQQSSDGLVVTDREVENAQTEEDIIAQLVDWQLKLEEQQKILNNYYQQGADKLGITKEQFQKLYDAYANKDWTTYLNLVGEFKLDPSEAMQTMREFETELGNEVRTVQQNIDTALANVEKLKGDLQQAGLSAAEIAVRMWDLGYRVPQDPNRRTGNPNVPPESGGYNYGGFDRSTYIDPGDPDIGSKYGFPGYYYIDPNDKYKNRIWASGAVLTSPTVGLMGEYAGAAYNPEIVTP